MEITSRHKTKWIDTFEKGITITYVCNLVYRTLCLESERICIITPYGYRPEQKKSLKALYWHMNMSKRNYVNIKHALNGGENRKDRLR